MRVALIAPPWISVPPPAYGGTEAIIDTLTRGLVDAGHEVVLATIGESTCPATRRIWTYEQEQAAHIGNTMVELRHLLHAYGELGDVDIVHDHTMAGPPLAAARFSGPVVTTNHGPFDDEAKEIYRAVAGRVPIVAISHHQASTSGDVPIARVIHHGLDVDRYRFGGGESGYLVFVGRMSPTKGVREAIEVAQRAGLPLRIAAKMREPAEREYFQTKVAPLLGGSIEYLGEVGADEKVDLLAGAVALVNPINWDEPFGLCMIEALACGTPVVATARGAAPEIVEQGITGLICDTLEEMVAAVEKAASLDRLACRQSVLERFSMRRMAADHVAFYEDVLAGLRHPPDHLLRLPA